MTWNLAIGVDVVLVLVVAREVWSFVGRYRRLKRELLTGEPGARARLYRRALAFQWGTAALALLALRLSGSVLRPDGLSLGRSPLIASLTRWGAADRGSLLGIGIGLAIGTLGLVLVGRRAGRAGARTPSARPWRHLLPDFTPLLPVTRHERLIWLGVATSAGICEEIVFRGWLLATLHGPVGLAGTALIVGAALGFGFAHAYQGPAGAVLATLAGLLFCTLYVMSGSLLLPILLHVAVDARFAALPTPRGSDSLYVPSALPSG